MMQPSQLLEQAWALIQEPGKWTKGAFARDVLSYEVSPVSNSAVCFCSFGAVDRVACINNSSDLIHLADSTLRAATAEIYGCGVDAAAINDSAECVEDLAPMWGLAIKLAKEEEENARSQTKN